MPIHLHRSLSPGLAGIWEIAEDESWFQDRLVLAPSESNRLQQYRGGRRLEFLASRYLVHLLTNSPARIPLEPDASGKPFLAGSNHPQISLSHTHGYAAALLSRDASVGVDIQRITPVVRRVSSRVFSEQEISMLDSPDDLVALTLLWAAREAAFKAWGKGGIDFRNHLRVRPLPLTTMDGEGYLEVLLERGEEKRTYEGVFLLKPPGYAAVFLREKEAE